MFFQGHNKKEEFDILFKLRFITYLFLLSVIILCVSGNLLGLTGPQEPFAYVSNLALAILSITFGLLYKNNMCKLETTLKTILLGAHLNTTLEMLLSCFSPMAYNSALIAGNMTLQAFIMLMAIIAVMRTFIVNFILVSSIAAFFTCIIVKNDTSLLDMSLVYTIIFLLASQLGYRFIRTTIRFNRKNYKLNKQQNEVLSFLCLSKIHISTLIKLSKEKGLSQEQIFNLIDMRSASPKDKEIFKENLYNNLLTYFREKTEVNDQLKRKLPMLTPSELEICKLIIEGHKIGKICAMLNKTESNITCQRTRIRSKLNLKKEDNLREVLLNIMGFNVKNRNKLRGGVKNDFSLLQSYTSN